jgi:3-(3-hydroxy-phenyl)propionate hydroxylase
LSVPAILTDSSLNTPDSDVFAGDMVPGAPMDDAPMQIDGQDAWLLDNVGKHFVVLLYVTDPAQASSAQLSAFKSLADGPLAPELVLVSEKAGAAPPGVRVLQDRAGRFAERFDAQAGTAYLIRPDQHVAARWRALDAEKIATALACATCNLQ